MRLNSKIISFLKEHTTITPSKLKELLSFKRDDKYWLKYSKPISLAMIEGLESKNWTLEEFSSALNVDYDIIIEMLSGNYNFTLKELAKIETILDINLLQTILNC